MKLYKVRDGKKISSKRVEKNRPDSRHKWGKNRIRRYLIDKA